MSHYDATAAFFGALIGEGLTDVVVSPGLRSVPLSLTAHAAPGLRCTVQHDERVAGFVALGLAVASDRPVAVVCTSGSAVANLLPAVVEAHHQRVPLLVVTGDRPPELLGWDSPQTIQQEGLFGAFAESMAMPVGAETTIDEAVDAARTAWQRTRRGSTPVHVNWPFREPLEPTGPIVVQPVAPEHRHPVPARSIDDADLAALQLPRGVIAAGQLDDRGKSAALAIAEATGWPIVADPLSGLRRPGRNRSVVATADHLLLNNEWASAHVPDLVLRLGSAPTSKSLRLWMERHRPKEVVVVDPAGHRRDPSRTMTRLITAEPAELADALAPGAIDRSWANAWIAAEDEASAVIAEMAHDVFEEAAATLATASALTTGSTWHVASSTPIRDVDWYVAETAARITSNRGTNGIDGTISTALGHGLSGQNVVVTLGDVALTHDVGGLLAAGRSEAAPTVVCYDNGGGGIFSLLPIANTAEHRAFQDVLHTPTDLDLRGLAAAATYTYDEASTSTDLSDLVRAGGRRLVRVPVTVQGSRDQLARIRTEIASRL